MIGWRILGIWSVIVILSLAWLISDLNSKNSHIHSLMRWVWILTVAYSGPLGLLIYYYSGRAQIKEDNIYRRSFRSVSHCYSGCGAGEITGILIATGLALGQIWLVVISFTLAFIAGYLMTAGPLIQEGVPVALALKDALYSETASIAMMEIVAISVDVILAGQSTFSEPIFWISIVISLSIGLLAAYPVNILLIKKGIKEGMHSPKH